VDITLKSATNKYSPKRTMHEKPRKLIIGKDSVVIGNVTGTVGDGSVVIGPTDAHGNTIINTPMAVGRNAYADETSIAIGAGASAGRGADFVSTINRISDAVAETNDPEIVAEFNRLISEFSGENGQPDPVKAKTILETLKTFGALNGSISLIEKAGELISSMIG
jgi:hypothetical protein